MKIFFIGNRINVLEQILELENVKIEIFALQNSLLDNYLSKKSISYKTFCLKDKQLILNLIQISDYNILISNGCPFIIPISDKNSSKLYLNIHPTYLPELRGKTPLNGVFFNNIDHFGATMHYLSDEIDGGNIIYQAKHPLTDDIDQGLVYYLSFKMEAIVFKKGWDILMKQNFSYEGIKQNIEKGSYFNRNDEMMMVDFETMNTIEIVKRVKSFGIQGQGCNVLKSMFFNKIFDVQVLINPYILSLYEYAKPGEILLNYDGKYLTKTIDGILKIIRYE